MHTKYNRVHNVSLVSHTNGIHTYLIRPRQEDRYAQIERDNRLLLEKMSDIMRKGGVDNHNSTSKYAKSLNKEARKRELHKITTENQVCVRAFLSFMHVRAHHTNENELGPKKL